MERTAISPRARPTRSSAEDVPCLDRISVLLVDDSRAVLEVLAEMLRYRGATVTAVDTAEEALRVLERARPDVLLSDLEMPDKGGYWLIGRIRALPAERGGATPAAAITGLDGPTLRTGVLRAGFQYHLAKPVDERVLAATVAILAGRA